MNPFLQIASFDAFDRVVDRDVYRALPDDWWLGVSDVVDSTRAIAAGRYKAVNMAGAAVLSAIMNGVGSQDFPFVFGGDGAAFAVGPGDAETARRALARTARWAGDELGLELRTGLVAIGDIRAAGRDVLVARYAPSRSVRYAMFAGGGLEWAEEQLKSGRVAIEPAPPDQPPDLTGLSCRWEAITAKRGVILSLIVRQGVNGDQPAFTSVVRRLLALLDGEDRHAHPVAPTDLVFKWAPTGLGLEAQASRGRWPLAFRRLQVRLHALLAAALIRNGIRLGGFDPAHYREQTARNSDFRKFGDGLHMTIDCTHDTAGRIEALLGEAEAAGAVRFGAFRQSEALMTCIVPSPLGDDHLHFIDGAQGGYSEAARRMKGRAGDPQLETSPPRPVHEA